MIRQFRIRPRAEKDIRATYLWYESQQAGLGGEFLASLRERMESVRTYPESCPVLYRNVRRAVVARFPYVVFDVADESRVAILAVLHQYRDPASWPSKAGESH